MLFVKHPHDVPSSLEEYLVMLESALSKIDNMAVAAYFERYIHIIRKLHCVTHDLDFILENGASDETLWQAAFRAVEDIAPMLHQYVKDAGLKISIDSASMKRIKGTLAYLLFSSLVNKCESMMEQV